MRQQEDQAINNFFQTYQEQQFFLQQQQMMQQQQQQQQQTSTTDPQYFFGGDRGFINMFSSNHEVSPSPIPWSMPPQVHNHDPFLVPHQPPSSPYASLFNRMVNPSLQFQHHAGGSAVATFGLQSDQIGKMSAQEIMEAKALAASKSHSEAERRRRERINNHLARLRTLLPSTTKTDKASLLAEVIQHVKELKRQTCLIEETSPVPTEADELTVDAADHDEDGKFVIKASLCCEDRSDLLPEIIKTLKALRLRTLKADITTLGGRVKNVLFITAEDHHDYSSSSVSDHDDNNNIGQYYHQQQDQYCSINSIQEALKAVMDQKTSVGDDSASSGRGVMKRQRTNIV